MCAVLLAGCGLGAPDVAQQTGDSSPRGFEPPVIRNSESPVSYPPALYEQEIGGTVILRLFINEDGSVVPDSTRIVESSGQTQLDSAALVGVTAMQFAPARQDGRPIATLFLQPVHFRHPANSALGEKS
jgi:TonB family protein